jgi:phosphopantetheinyl transferase (holo-ACP synthase)
MESIEGLRLVFVPLRAETPEMPRLESRGYLCDDEEKAYASLVASKRRRDWLGGRLAAKLALAAELDSIGVRRPLNGIVIGNDLDGVPTWRLLKPGDVPAWPISISHSAGLAAAAVHTGAARLGIDLEKVENRDPAWLEIAFHPDERGETATPEAATRLWTVKEAALKVLGLGLRADLWDVRCEHGRVRLLGGALQRHGMLGSPQLRFSTRSIEGGCVLTVACAGGAPGERSRATEKGDFAWNR